ncbi:hypothetical protein DYB30_004410 [Aphanomyces astaci]|uniref:uracil phosphoribosyltransferase n=1 Tax=Aphanomyces astaci TaxID=112090 RepID=A0A397DDD7_APHAT|nr:hypothetical protein DYB30_004410 [Aphanomyces astaci]
MADTRREYGDEIMEDADGGIARGKTGRPPAAVRVHYDETGRMKNASTALLVCKFCHKEVAGRAVSLEGHLKKCPNAPEEVRPPKIDKKERMPGHLSSSHASSMVMAMSTAGALKAETKHAMKKLCTVTSSMESKFKNLVVPKLNSIQSLHLMMRDKRSTHLQFKQHADRLMRLLAEEALATCAMEFATVWTPNGVEYSGMRPNSNVCAVPIERSGDSLLEQVLQCDPAVSVGKLLIEQDESSPEKSPVLFYSKLPPRIPSFDRVLLLEPTLATGCAAVVAIRLLLDAGVDERNIVLVSVVACPVGLTAVFQLYPEVKIIATAIDPELNSTMDTSPGLGDFGDRYFNTMQGHKPHVGHVLSSVRHPLGGNVLVDEYSISQLQKLKYGDELMEAAEQIARGKTGRPPAAVRIYFEETGKMKNASTTLLLCKFCHKEIAGRAISLEGHLKKCPNAPEEARPPKGAKKEKAPRLASDMAFGGGHGNGNGGVKGEHKHSMKKLCTVTTSMEGKFRNLLVPKLAAIQSLHLMLRDKRSSHLQFKHHADRLMRIMAKEALAVCAVEFATVWTPNGMEYSGMRPNNNLCAVSIQRSGDCLLEQVLQCDPSVSVGTILRPFVFHMDMLMVVSSGKLLIQRDETSAEKTPILFYSKLPPRLPTFDRVLLLDPMLATGGSAMMAIQLLRNAGVDEANIVLVNVVSCPVGLSYIFDTFPSIKILTSAIDPDLNANKSVLPGLGSFGDRYYNTTN